MAQIKFVQMFYSDKGCIISELFCFLKCVCEAPPCSMEEALKEAAKMYFC